MSACSAGACSCTGTLKCFSSLGGSGSGGGSAAAATNDGSGWGTVTVLPQAGHSMVDPAPLASTSNSCSHTRHLKLMSILNSLWCFLLTAECLSPAQESEQNQS